MGDSDFTWNPRPGMPQESSVEGEEGEISHYLVNVHSVIDQLHHTYLSSEQRSQLATVLREGFFGLQKVASKEKDQETRHRLTHYLVIIGSMGVREGDHLFTLLEALSQGTFIEWCHHFYSATHGISQRDPKGKTLTFIVDKESLTAEREARHQVMLWLARVHLL